jgi:hypothetical protein
MDCAHGALILGDSRQRKTDPDLVLWKHRLRQRRLMHAVERQHFDRSAIGDADFVSSAPAAAKSMYWSSSKSAMVRLLARREHGRER